MTFRIHILILLLFCGSLFAFPPTVENEEPVDTATALSNRLGEDLRPGQNLGDNYTLTGKLGQGGLGVVYEVTINQGPERGKKKAVKFFHPDQPEFVQISEEFFASREGRALQRMGNVHKYSAPEKLILKSVDGKRETEVYVLVNEVADTTLKDLFTLPTFYNQEQKAQRLESVLDQAEQGLANFMRLGLVHQDIKPANIFITWEAPHVLKVEYADYDGARRIGDTKLLNTDFYAAPERFVFDQDLPAVPSEDIFSLFLSFAEVTLVKPGERGLVQQFIATLENPIAEYPLFFEMLRDPQMRSKWNKFLEKKFEEIKPNYSSGEGKRIFKKLKEHITAGLEMLPGKRMENILGLDSPLAKALEPHVEYSNELLSVSKRPQKNRLWQNVCSAYRKIGGAMNRLNPVRQREGRLEAAELVFQ